MKKISVILFVLFMSLYSIHIFKSSFQNKKQYYIGLAGPLSGENKHLGEYMLNGAALAIDEIRKSGDLPNIDLQLTVQDDQSDPSTHYRPIEAARQLVKQENLLAVVGHYFSTATIAATPIYEKHLIPVVTPTSTQHEVTANSRYVFSVIFDDAFQSAYVANYIMYGLQKKQIALIYSDIPYGQSLKKQFIKELSAYDRSPFLTVSLDRENFQSHTLKKYLSEIEKADVVFLAMRYDTAAKIVKYLKGKEITADLIGPESIGSDDFLHEAGIFSEGVYAVSPFLINLFGKGARNFYSAYQKAYQEKPTWIATYTYEAVMLLARAIRKNGPQPEKIRNFLSLLTSKDYAFESIGGKIYFDDKGACRRLITIGQVQHREYFPAKFQLTDIKYPQLYRDSNKKEALFELNHTIMKRRSVIYTGINVQEIEEFDIGQSVFKATFNLWFRWHCDKRKEIDFELVDGNIEKIEQIDSYHRENNHYLAYQIEARINDDFPLYDYPLDHQILSIRIKPRNASIEDLIFVADMKDSNFTQPHLDFSVWNNYKNINFVDVESRYLSFRNPRYNQKILSQNYSVFHYDIYLKRYLKQYILKFFPLLILILVSSTIFFMPTTILPSRIALSITTLLSSMAFHMSQSVYLGKIGYTTKVDEFFIITYFLIFITITENVVIGYLKESEKESVCIALDRVSRYLYPLLVIGGFIKVFVF
ncbi:branched chain amino acid ABC transporter (substrate-binding protein) [Candidatus Magnetomorum sp. HK-1]|nr:branched chain amino acid ABC transporter (substrate-binding protein) [Candidatus Magnetomorum sp. HK-1]